jgi:hypothetical protein
MRVLILAVSDPAQSINTITMGTVIHFGLEFTFPRRCGKKWRQLMETRESPQRYIVQGPGQSDVGRAGHRACIITSPTVWSTRANQCRPARSDSCFPSACARDALPLSFLVSFTRTTIPLGVSLGGCHVVPEHYHLHLAAARPVVARVRSRHTQSQ